MHRMQPHAARTRPGPRLIVPALVLAAALVGSDRASAALIRRAAERSYPDIAADINGSVRYDYQDATGTGTFELANTPYLLAGGPTAAEEYTVAPDLRRHPPAGSQRRAGWLGELGHRPEQLVCTLLDR